MQTGITFGEPGVKVIEQSHMGASVGILVIGDSLQYLSIHFAREVQAPPNSRSLYSLSHPKEFLLPYPMESSSILTSLLLRKQQSWGAAATGLGGRVAPHTFQGIWLALPSQRRAVRSLWLLEETSPVFLRGSLPC